MGVYNSLDIEEVADNLEVGGHNIQLMMEEGLHTLKVVEDHIQKGEGHIQKEGEDHIQKVEEGHIQRLMVRVLHILMEDHKMMEGEHHIQVEGQIDHMQVEGVYGIQVGVERMDN